MDRKEIKAVHSPGPWEREGTVIWSPKHRKVIAVASNLKPESGLVEYEKVGVGSPDLGEIYANASLLVASLVLKEALERLMLAASCRENTMGDPARLIEVQAELRDATNEARSVLALAGKVQS